MVREGTAMNTECAPEPVGIEGPLADLLARYLVASRWLQHPYADGMTLADAVAAEYPAALADGTVPGPAELARRHPALADAVAVFFGLWGDPSPVSSAGK